MQQENATSSFLQCDGYNHKPRTKTLLTPHLHFQLTSGVIQEVPPAARSRVTVALAVLHLFAP
jgi:hypothetical protein